MEREKISMEKLINNLKGVKSSNIVFGENSEIIELHVLTDSSRAPKQVARDIQSAISSQYNETIDHKVISIAQLDYIDDVFENDRIVIESVSVQSKGRMVKSDVTLSYKGRVETLSTEHPLYANSRYKASAISTIKALESLLNISNIIYLENLDFVRIGDTRLVVVILISFLDGREEILTGTAIVNDQKDLSVVKAVLDSLNRKIKIV